MANDTGPPVSILQNGHVLVVNADGSINATTTAAAGGATAANQVLEIADLDLIAASASVLDDWDESDRAKVNPIVGQAGVAAGAGAVGATVQRTTLASDDPAVAVLGATNGAAVITDADGTIQRYLRGLVKLFITAGAALVSTTEIAPTTIYNGKKTVTTAGTRVTLASSQAIKSVTIKALAANTGVIYVGDGSVASTTGYALAASETISMDIANLATVNLDSSVNGEGVTYIAVN